MKLTTSLALVLTKLMFNVVRMFGRVAMKIELRKILAAIVILIGAMAASPVLADYEDGVAAIERGQYAAALKEFLPLADQGHAAAQYYLGLMYEQGDGVEQDHVESARWYTRAAEQGDGLSQMSLSFLYLEGEGVALDLVEALKWLYLAKDSPIRGADMGIDLTEQKMTPAQIESARQKAQAWRPKVESETVE